MCILFRNIYIAIIYSMVMSADILHFLSKVNLAVLAMLVFILAIDHNILFTINNGKPKMKVK